MPSDIPSLINQIIHTKDLEAISTSIAPNELKVAMQITFYHLSIATTNWEREYQACKEQKISLDGCMTEVPRLDRFFGSRDALGDSVSDEERREYLMQAVKNILVLREDVERLRRERGRGSEGVCG